MNEVIGLTARVFAIAKLFDDLASQNAGNYQIEKVKQFRKENPELNEDLDFCFEVLAGKHKVGYTYFRGDNIPCPVSDGNNTIIEYSTIKSFYNMYIRRSNTTDMEIWAATRSTPRDTRFFFYMLVNRIYKLGYSNSHAMATNLNCMLAKTYPEHVREGFYYIQEKLNGNRCIAYHDGTQWKFVSRSGKPLNVYFNMAHMYTDQIYDGEIMTRGKMGNRDFATTSGVINSKIGDKSDLIYFVYDILDDKKPYKERRLMLKDIRQDRGESDNVKILKVLNKIWVYPNPQYNWQLEEHLDAIVDKGGEGIMLRDPDAPYYHSKNSGDRKPYLLKYKKTKTCDLRIIGWNEGNGKYEGFIGSFICETDDGSVKVNVAGMTDDVRMSNPNDWIGKIIEVAYFEGSKAKNKDTQSLQFPRMKKVRYDKTETSMY